MYIKLGIISGKFDQMYNKLGIISGKFDQMYIHQARYNLRKVYQVYIRGTSSDV